MPFYKTAQTPIVSVYESSGKFSKRAAQNEEMTTQEDDAVKTALNILSKDVLKAVSKVYNISDNINDYIFPVPRAVTADEPNNNGDNFRHDELMRFSANHRCLVFQTFRNDPLHIEHAAEDPKTARGYIPDAHYVTASDNDKHVLTVVAMDTTKDAPLAEGLLSGDIDTFSMGCICDSVRCSYSKCTSPVAHSDRDLCDHLKWYKMSSIDGELIYEDCLGVEYQELSVVGNPADPKAKTQALLKYATRKAQASQSRAAFSLLSTLINEEDQQEVARFFSKNAGKLPESVLRLADKLL
jgi:hypothetical protein